MTCQCEPIDGEPDHDGDCPRGYDHLCNAKDIAPMREVVQRWAANAERRCRAGDPKFRTYGKTVARMNAGIIRRAAELSLVSCDCQSLLADDRLMNDGTHVANCARFADDLITAEDVADARADLLRWLAKTDKRLYDEHYRMERCLVDQLAAGVTARAAELGIEPA